MQTKQVFNKNTIGFLAISSLVLLPSCTDWIREKFGGTKPMEKVEPAKKANDFGIPEDGSKVLVTMNGKPLITEKSLEAEKNELLESNPQLKAMIALMDPKQLDRNLLDGLVSRSIIQRYIKEEGIDQKAEYQQEYKRMIRSIIDMLNHKYFMQAFPAKVTDAEIKEFYEKHKDEIPNLLLSRGGVNAVGIAFANEKEAKDFLTKVKEAKGDIQKVAQEAKLGEKIKDFKLVHSQTIGMNNMLREKIISIAKCPTVELFKIDDDAFWVVSASSKEAPTYRPFDQVKEELKSVIEKDKAMENFSKQVELLKPEYKIQVDQEFMKETEETPDEPTQKATATENTDKKPRTVAQTV